MELEEVSAWIWSKTNTCRQSDRRGTPA